jgi:DNA modification methylase
MMQKYWARKPHNLISEYLEHYTEAGDLVLDPFCGSGVTVIEALGLGRKAIATDVSPQSIFLTRASCLPVDIDAYLVALGQVEAEVDAKTAAL